MKFLYRKDEVYNSHCYFVQYNDDYFKIVLNKYQREKGFEEVDKKVFSYDERELERVSLSRTKNSIKEICLCNNFQYFATITINSKNCDRYSLIECQKILKRKLKTIKQYNKYFAYIFITEKHKDGAFHFHGLVKNIPLYTNNNGYYSNKTLDKIGFNSFSEIKSYNKCCNYITKYITKECIKNEHNQIYISSRGLKRADKYEIPLLDINYSFENDFVKIKEFSSSDLCSKEIFQILGLYDPQKFEKNHKILGEF